VVPTQRTASTPLVIIYGPTGVGKTDLVLALAEVVPAAIINMDVGQLYTPFGIGTAKPDWKREAAPHYLFDYLNEPVDYTAADYSGEVAKLAAAAHQAGRMPCAVGGSGFYAYSLLFAHQSSKVPSLTAELQDVATEDLWERLNRIDPERADAINKNDRYRLERALAVWQATGEKPSSKKPLFAPIAQPFLVIGVMREREDLYVRINKRTKSMLKEGWIEEVAALVDTPWEDFLRKKKLIGYAEVFDYVKGILTYPDMVRLIQEQTRQYAKRQGCFWRMMERNVQQELSLREKSESMIKTINLTNMPFDRYIKQLSDDMRALQRL
jgi:tRNA dimethylallyltransferase